MNDYNVLKVDFVSGHNGSSFSDVSLVTYLPVSFFLLRHVFVVCYPLWNSIWTDFGIIGLPIVLSMTILAGNLSFLYVLAATATVAIILAKLVSQLRNGYLQWKWIDIAQSAWNTLHMSVPMPLPFVTQARVSIMLLSIVAILAVDFPAFPRRFAKTETYGVGLMDVGIGLFLVSLGMVSPESRSAVSSRLEWKWNISKNVLGAAPLLLLGMVRLVTTSSIGYHLHVSEYGVHWNFFFTLGIVKIVSSFLEPISVLLSFRYFYCTLSLLIILAYQWALSRLGLAEYLVQGAAGDGSRGNILDANREGLFSCCGFVALYLASIQFGKVIFQSRPTVKCWLKDIQYIVYCTGMLWTLAVTCHLYIQPVSRRFANLSYYLWILSAGMTAVVLYLMVDILVLFICHHLILPKPPGLFRKPSQAFYTVKLIPEVSSVGNGDTTSHPSFQQICEVHSNSPTEDYSCESLSDGERPSSREGSAEVESSLDGGPVIQQKWDTESSLRHRVQSLPQTSSNSTPDKDTPPRGPQGTKRLSQHTLDFDKEQQQSVPTAQPATAAASPNPPKSSSFTTYPKEYVLAKHCCLISSIGGNQLAFFLLGNLLTGLVNLMFDTLHYGSAMSVCIILLYLFVLCMCAYSADRLGIRTKVW